MGIKKEKVRQKNKTALKTNSYYNGVCGTDLVSPVKFPDVLGENGRKLNEFGVENRKECTKKNLGFDLTPSELWSKAKLIRKVK